MRVDNPFSQYIIFFGHYIDDVLLIWTGGPDLFSTFVAYCNDNSLGLSFTHEINQNELVFLDLVLSHDEQTIITSNHNEPTSGKSYLHFNSCYHPTWKDNIPKGQFHGLRRNCTKTEDYMAQGRHMQRKFEEKGYPRALVMDAFLQNKTQLPKNKNKNDRSSTMANTARFVSTFNSKHRAITKIINKHYNILKRDQVLAPLLPPRPQVTFRRSLTVNNIIVPSKLTKPNSGSFLDIRTFLLTELGSSSVGREAASLANQSPTVVQKLLPIVASLSR